MPRKLNKIKVLVVKPTRAIREYSSVAQIDSNTLKEISRKYWKLNPDRFIREEVNYIFIVHNNRIIAIYESIDGDWKIWQNENGRISFECRDCMNQTILDQFLNQSLENRWRNPVSYHIFEAYL